jgi:peptidyl-prolyl cis-trans isomerase SurA
MRRAFLAWIGTPFQVLALVLPAASFAQGLSTGVADTAPPAGAAPPAEIPAPPGQSAGATNTPAAPVSNGVVAVVNNYPISEYDLSQRMALFAVTSGTQVTNETQPQVRTQVLRTMEDEIMELQEAAKLKITVTNEDVDKALQAIAVRNRLTPDQMLATLTKAGVKAQTFTLYIATQLIWQKVVVARYGADIMMGDRQLSDAMDLYLNDLRRRGVIESR